MHCGTPTKGLSPVHCRICGSVNVGQHRGPASFLSWQVDASLVFTYAMYFSFQLMLKSGDSHEIATFDLATPL